MSGWVLKSSSVMTSSWRIPHPMGLNQIIHVATDRWQHDLVGWKTLQIQRDTDREDCATGVTRLHKSVKNA